MKRVPLVECGEPVLLASPFGAQPVLASTSSGWVSMKAPPEEVLKEYYSTEYGRDNEAYYSLEAAYAPSLIAWHVKRIEELVANSGLESPLRLHELGCSFGGVVSGLRAAGHNATGSDLSAAAIKAGREQMANAWIECAAHARALSSYSGELDVVYASHTLEHDPTLFATLEAVRGALNENGLLLGAVPNAFYIRALLDGFVSHPWAAYPDHLEMLSPGGILELCEATGFVPIDAFTGSFEQTEWLDRHFGEASKVERVRKTWEAVLATLGLGMELVFVLAPAGQRAAKSLQDRSDRTHAKLRVMAEQEVHIREFLSSCQR